MESMTNKYGVYFKDFNYWSDDKFAFNWLGAKVQFKILGQVVDGTVAETDNIDHSLVVEFQDGRKCVKTKGHFNCFKKLN
jgi:hypothetical protein